MRSSFHFIYVKRFSEQSCLCDVNVDQMNIGDLEEALKAVVTPSRRWKQTRIELREFNLVCIVLTIQERDHTYNNGKIYTCISYIRNSKSILKGQNNFRSTDVHSTSPEGDVSSCMGIRDPVLWVIPLCMVIYDHMILFCDSDMLRASTER